jgi:hypothetical protein
MKKIELYDYQKDLIKTFEKERFIAVKHSRQIGITTTLVSYVVDYILNGNDKTICLISNTKSNSVNLLNKIRCEITEEKFIKNNINEIILKNGNRIKVCSNIDGVRGYGIDLIVVDNAGFSNNLEKIIETVIPSIMSKIDSKIILISSNNRNSYFNKLFNSSNIFYKKILHWDINPNHDNIWYEEMRLAIGDESKFKSEIDLIDEKEINEKNKNRVITVRLNDDIINKISEKLIEKDLSLSEYIRELINKDI